VQQGDLLAAVLPKPQVTCLNPAPEGKIQVQIQAQQRFTFSAALATLLTGAQVRAVAKYAGCIRFPLRNSGRQSTVKVDVRLHQASNQLEYFCFN
jgi:hypothetical protein